MDYYYDLCKECEHLYHCFGRDSGERIEDDDMVNMYLRTDNCKNYYPERKQ